ncbi:MAG TPA: chemotaxis protein CheR [Desulfobulbaceae bacterium]|nr:chemotaxis protein CheR [Desulfobulbaceae bacterium]
MNQENGSKTATPVMKTATFDLFSEYIQEVIGIKMGHNKQTMLQARLMKRLRILGLKTYEEYYSYLFSEEGQRSEMPLFVHQVTTNKTDFFREPAHYEQLVKQVLPVLIREKKYSFQRPLRVWSSACSTGEEPYTLAMVLADFAETHQLPDFTILATDISPEVLQHVAQGVYDEARISPVPFPMRKKYMLRAKDPEKRLVRIVPELRAKVRPQWINLKDYPYNIQERMDIIFCRNVIIYFSHDTQVKVMLQLCNHLEPDGYLFLGHSETLNNFNLPLKQVAATVYRKQ